MVRRLLFAALHLIKMKSTISKIETSVLYYISLKYTIELTYFGKIGNFKAIQYM